MFEGVGAAKAAEASEAAAKSESSK